MKILNPDGKPIDTRKTPEPQKVMVGTPCYDGKTHVGFTLSLTDTIIKCAAQGVLVTWQVHRGVPYLPIVRNKLLFDFLNSDADTFVFIDSDVQWEPDAFLRLLHWDVDLVAGVYPYKRREESYPVKFDFDENSMLQQDPETGLIECLFVPTGFMKISRNLVETMLEKLGRDETKVIEKTKAGAYLGEYYCLFDTRKVGTEWLGEDVDFCRIWREECGGKVYVDPEMSFTHTGSMDYQGNLGNYLRKEMERQQAAAQESGSNAA